MSPRGGKMSFLERGGNKYPFVDQNIDPCDREHRDASTLANWQAGIRQQRGLNQNHLQICSVSNNILFMQPLCLM
jgi:hypothetical protein